MSGVFLSPQKETLDPLATTLCCGFFLKKFLFIYDSHTEREREAETQAEGEAGSMHREPDLGLDPESPGSRPGPKAGAKPLRHPGIPAFAVLMDVVELSAPTPD